MNHRDEARDFLSSRRARITPEFARYHADFVDETLRNASLSEHDRVVVQLGATIAAGAPTAFRDLLDAALDGPLSPTEAKEIVYQAVAYVGSARVGDFLTITDTVLDVLTVLVPLIGYPRTLNALAAVNEGAPAG
jgi:4-carboxymuconolactone decarboxylase